MTCVPRGERGKDEVRPGICSDSASRGEADGGAGEGVIVVLRQQQQVVEVGYAVAVEVTGREGGGLSVVLGQQEQIAEVQRHGGDQGVAEGRSDSGLARGNDHGSGIAQRRREGGGVRRVENAVVVSLSGLVTPTSWLATSYVLVVM